MSARTTFDLVLKAAHLAHDPERLVDIGVRNGRIAAIAPSLPHASEIEPINGELVVPGFVETHIHLDKSCIIDRCSCNEGSLREAIAETPRAKRAFTEADITERARRTLERAIENGTMHMRSHVEVDPRLGLQGFRAVRELARSYAWAIDRNLRLPARGPQQ